MHFHCDPIFTCPQAVHIAESVDLAGQYVSIFRDEPDFRCILSEIDYLQGYFNTFVEDRELFLGSLREGRIETSGSYSEPNENSVGGEGLARNIAYGQWYLVDYLGARGDVYMPFDVFGHVRQLPQLLAKAGFQAAVWTKGSNWGANPSIWVAPDGSRIMNRVESYGSVDWGTGDQVANLIDGYRKRIDPQTGEMPGSDLGFRGSDFVSPPWWIVGNVQKMRENSVLLSVPSAYFAELKEQIDNGSLHLPVTAREMSQYHIGTALSRTELKIGNRLGEETALEAEIWATLATLFGEKYPEAQLDHAWRQLLFSQHHDSITGTSNDQSYLDLMSHLRESLAESGSARARALTALTGKISTDGEDGVPVVIYNSNSFTVTESVTVNLPEELCGKPVTAIDGNGTPVVLEQNPETPDRVRIRAADVPGIGHTTIWLRVGEETTHEPEAIHSEHELVTIKTPFARITFDPIRGGGITSLIETATGQELVDKQSRQTLNDFVCLKEGAGPEPSWEVHTSGGKFFSSSVRAQVEAHRTATGWRVLIRHPFPDTDGVVRTVELYDDDPRMDCSVELLNYSGSRQYGDDRFTRPWGGLQEFDDGIPEDRDFFGVLFPTGVSGTVPVWSDRFGQRVVRPAEGWLDYRSHQRRNESGCALYSAEKWISQSPGPVVRIDDSNRGIPLTMVKVVYPDNPALRALGEQLIEALAVRGITATPALPNEAPESDPLQTKQAIALGGPDINEWSRRALENADLPDSSCVVADIVLKNENTLPVLVFQGDESTIAADVERIIAELNIDTINISETSVASSSAVKLEDAGLAVMNRGTIAAGCENDGSMFLALQHTAYWCDWATPSYLGFPFAPERKTTRYEYAILPFAGSWRSAEVPMHAHAYNRPLRAVVTERHGGDIPAEKTWVSLEGTGTLLSTLKPAGNASARMTDDVADAAEGTIARIWNWDGNTSDANIAMWPGITQACSCDLAERKGDALSISDGTATIPVGANAVETMELRLSRENTVAPDGNLPLPAQIADCRWWMNNTGAAPVGNTPCSLSLKGDVLPGESTDVSLSVANNAKTRKLSGTITLRAPEGWEVSPASIAVSLDPMGVETHSVSVSAVSPGRLIAEMDIDGVVYRDTLLIGEIIQPEVSVVAAEGAIDVTLTNPSQDSLDLDVTLISPLETWSEAEGLGLFPTDFRVKSVHLDAGEEKNIQIPVPDGFFENTWGFVKISGHNRASYHITPQVQTSVYRNGAFNTPCADAAVRMRGVDEGSTLTISRQDVPPEGCANSPVPDVTKYWTVDAYAAPAGAENAIIELGIIPPEITSLNGPDSARIAYWNGDEWTALDTSFDEHTWTLSAEISPALLKDRTHWTITGDTCLEWITKVGGRYFESTPWVGDIDNDGRSETVIGTAWNQICLLSADGDVRWRRQFGGWIWPSAAFTVADVTGDGQAEIVAAPSDRTFGVLNTDGMWLWKRNDLPFAIKQAPTVVDINGDGENEVIVPVNDDAVWAFTRNGDLLWKAPVTPMRLSPAAVLESNGITRVLVNAGGKRLAFVGPGGAVEKELVFAKGAARARTVAAPVVTSELHDGSKEILFGGHDGILRLLSVDGEEIWQINLESPIVSAPVVLAAENGHGPVVICNTFQQKTFCIDTEGREVWQHTFNSNLQGSPSLADMDGDGETEIVIGAAREKKTHVLKRDGTKTSVVPFTTIWTCTPGIKPSEENGLPTVVLGGLEEAVVSAKPFAAKKEE